MVRYGCTYYIPASSIETSLEELAATLAKKLSNGTVG
jgi:hypothetical protein